MLLRKFSDSAMLCLTASILLLSGTYSSAAANRPEWQDFESTYLEATKRLSHTPGVMAGLAEHSQCQFDTDAKRLLENYGGAMLDGIEGIRANNAKAAELLFDEAISYLSDFNRYLYCIDRETLGFWDEMIADFLSSAYKTQTKDLDFKDRLQALWNPVLLVADAKQFSTQSKLVSLFSSIHESRITSTVGHDEFVLLSDVQTALSSYPVDSYGAAWLDDFLTGQLVRVTGSDAMEKLLFAISEPTMLGVGRCTLLSHANKAIFDQPCLNGVELGLADCRTSKLANLSSGIGSPLPRNYWAMGLNNPPQQPNTGLVFGRSRTQFAIDVCAILENANAAADAVDSAGLPAMPDSRMPHQFGCAFGIVVRTLSETGWAEDALQCAAERRGPAYGLGLDAVKIKFPAPECRTFEEKSRNDADRILEDLTKETDRALDRLLRDTSVERTADGGRIETTTWTDPETQTTMKTTKTYDKNGNQTDARTGPMLGRNEVSVTYYKDGDKWYKETEYDDGRPPKQEAVPGPPPKGPPTQKQCDPTAAMERADSMYDCVVDKQGRPGLAGPSGPGPVSRGTDRPLPGTPGAVGRQGSPEACNKISMGSVWNNPTGPGADAPSIRHGGPMSFQRFIPKIHGAIDPVRADYLRILVEKVLDAEGGNANRQ